jgi:hypothetical protein
MRCVVFRVQKDHNKDRGKEMLTRDARMATPRSDTSSPSSSTYWRHPNESQTDVLSSDDTTVRLVQEAFLQLVLMSRKTIEQARADDLVFLGEVASFLWRVAEQFQRSRAVMLDEVKLAAEHLQTLEEEHFSFLVKWERKERHVRHLQIDRATVDSASLKLAAAVADKQYTIDACANSF